MARRPITLDLGVTYCHVCLEVPPSNVFHCENGHFMCSNCAEKRTTCAQCPVLLGNNLVRNRAVESFLDNATFPCANRNCPEVFKREEWQCHKKICPHRPVNICPKLGLRKCKVLVDSGDALWQHLKDHQVHVGDLKVNLKIKNFLANPNGTGSRKSKKVLFTNDDGEHFLLIIQVITVKGQQNQIELGTNEMLSVFFLYLGDCVEKALELSANITVDIVYKTEKTRAHSWSGLPINYKSVDVYSDICPSVSLPVSFFKRLVESTSKFKESGDNDLQFGVVFKICISKLSSSIPSSPPAKRPRLVLVTAGDSEPTNDNAVNGADLDSGSNSDDVIEGNQ